MTDQADAVSAREANTGIAGADRTLAAQIAALRFVTYGEGPVVPDNVWSAALDPHMSPADTETLRGALHILDDSVDYTTSGIPSTPDFLARIAAREQQADALISSRVADIRAQLKMLQNEKSDAAYVIAWKERLEAELQRLELIAHQRAVREDLMNEFVKTPVHLRSRLSRLSKHLPLRRNSVLVNSGVPSATQSTSAGVRVLAPDSVQPQASSQSSRRSKTESARLRREQKEQERLRLQRLQLEKQRRVRRHKDFLTGVVQWGNEFYEANRARKAQAKKLARDIRGRFEEVVRRGRTREERRQKDRMRALRENNEEAYFQMLEEQKNDRLLHVLEETDKYMAQLGAMVETQRMSAEGEEADKEKEGEGEASAEGDEGAAQEDAEGEKPAAEGGDEGEPESRTVTEKLRSTRERYYAITHRIAERVTKQPDLLHGGELKPYQIDGLQWLVSLYNNNLNGVLADEMGLGKTIQTIALLAYVVETKKNGGPFLVVVPSSTVPNWANEFERWCQSLSVVVYRGDPSHRRSLWEREMRDGMFNVCLTTYEFILKDQSRLRKFNWEYIIVDEGHRVKNAQSRLSVTLAMFDAKRRVLLTGTPLQNNLPELWALLNFLLPKIFNSCDTFEAWFSRPLATAATSAADKDKSMALSEEESLLVIQRLHQVLRPFLLRRTKSDVLTQLPEKQEKVIKCDLSAAQRILYKQIQSKGMVTVDKFGFATKRGLNNIMMQMRKAANHPYLFHDHDYYIDEHLVRASGKFAVLDNILRKMRSTGHKTLIFSQMVKVLDIMAHYLDMRRWPFLRLDGTVSTDLRGDLLAKWNAPDSEYDIFLLSTRAGGLGLNLQAADTVVIFDSDWNPMQDLQAQARAHRIGQTREVRVFRLVSARTIDESIIDRAAKKLHDEALIIEGGRFNTRAEDEREQKRFLEDLLSSGPDTIMSERAGTLDADDDLDNELPDPDEINEMLARSPDELRTFADLDAEFPPRTSPHPLMTEDELPDWLMTTDALNTGGNNIASATDSMSDLSEAGNNNSSSLGRGRRRRGDVRYDDGLSEREFLRLVDRGYNPTKIFQDQRRRQRKVKLGPYAQEIEREADGGRERESDDDDDDDDMDAAAVRSYWAMSFDVSLSADDVPRPAPKDPHWRHLVYERRVRWVSGDFEKPVRKSTELFCTRKERFVQEMLESERERERASKRRAKVALDSTDDEGDDDGDESDDEGDSTDDDDDSDNVQTSLSPPRKPRKRGAKTSAKASKSRSKSRNLESDGEDATSESSEEIGSGSLRVKLRLGKKGKTKRERERGGASEEEDAERERERLTEWQMEWYRLLKWLEEQTDEEGRPYCEIFMEFPDRKLYADYYSVIKHPVCFESLHENLPLALRRSSKSTRNRSTPSHSSGVSGFRTPNAFFRDVFCMFENAKAYNEEGSFVYTDAETLGDMFVEKWKAWCRDNERDFQEMWSEASAFHATHLALEGEDPDLSLSLSLSLSLPGEKAVTLQTPKNRRKTPKKTGNSSRKRKRSETESPVETPKSARRSRR